MNRAAAAADLLERGLDLSGTEGEQARVAVSKLVGLAVERLVLRGLDASLVPPRGESGVPSKDGQSADLLFDAGDIADLLGVSRKHVTNSIITRPDFPKPVVRLSQRTRRWSQNEVLEYVRKRTRAGR